MRQHLDLSGLEKRIQQLRNIVNLNAVDLMFSWMKIMEEDNRKGILQGLDKDGVPMRPVTYRPRTAQPIRVTKAVKKETLYTKQTREQFRLGQASKLRKGIFAGLGPAVSGINNNLSTAEYQLLGGPPLAPRDQFSRVITNYETTFGSPAHGAPNWFAEGRWNEVVSTKGMPFLAYHFDGIGVPRRNLRGVRPSGIAKALSAMRNWARGALKEHFD